mmetsp:Transcript_6021/g.13281  ORF Transcript_6021/g.13281 Transcript_6021/m.13281 type:complete len:135 (-) Transcript_6021:86-490(-)
MRNTGDGQWREWRWESNVVPLYVPDPKNPRPAHQKPLTEVTHLAIGMMHAKGSLPQLRDAIKDLSTQPDSPGGRINEQRLRDTIKVTVSQVLSPEEMEQIFPAPPQPDEGGSRKGSKVKRGGSKLPPEEKQGAA